MGLKSFESNQPARVSPGYMLRFHIPFKYLYASSSVFVFVRIVKRQSNSLFEPWSSSFFFFLFDLLIAFKLYAYRIFQKDFFGILFFARWHCDWPIYFNLRYFPKKMNQIFSFIFNVLLSGSQAFVKIFINKYVRTSVKPLKVWCKRFDLKIY